MTSKATTAGKSQSRAPVAEIDEYSDAEDDDQVMRDKNTNIQLESH